MSSFSIIQYLLVFIVTFIVAIDQFSFLESLYQPIVVGPVIGAILGDMKTGLVVGGTYQLIQIGSMPVGGSTTTKRSYWWDHGNNLCSFHAKC